MGTRGLFGIVIDGQLKAGYNQYDSYPSGRGVENLRWLRENTQDGWQHLIDQARALRVVDEDQQPTEADVEALTEVTDLGVSEQSTQDWYCLTRQTHGDIGAILGCGYVLDGKDFAKDSLFCEWGYLVDFDAKTFDLYRGFQQSPPTDGRWAGVAEADSQGYYPIQRVASYPLSSLPTEDVLIAVAEAIYDKE